MASAVAQQPKSMTRAKQWDPTVEDAYRFQLAGYRDEIEYRQLKQTDAERWSPEDGGQVKKLQRKDGCFYYFNRKRECSDKDLNKCKLYTYE